MEISEVRIKLMNGNQDRLLGFCSLTFSHAFVIRDLKIINGDKGAFVAMPSRKLTDRCPSCGNKNALRSFFCSQCGKGLGNNRSFKMPDGRARLYADIAHPINCECRDLIQSKVMEAFEQERILAKRADYVCRYDLIGDYDPENLETESWEEPAELAPDQEVSKSEIAIRNHSPHRLPPAPHDDATQSALFYSPEVGGFGEGVFIEV